MKRRDQNIELSPKLLFAKLVNPVTAITLLLISMAALAQVADSEEGEVLEMDAIPFPVQEEREVTAVDLQSGVIFLDGEGYSLAAFSEGGVAIDTPPLEPGVDLRFLTEGDQVIVQTDGTASTSNHFPLILSIKKM